MGLDLYAGPLTRYYSGNWQTINQRLFGAQIVYATGKSPWVSQHAADLGVREFRSTLSTRLAEHGHELNEWNEDPSAPYFSDKPTHECRGALVLWAAYIHRRDLSRPLHIPEEIERDPAYSQAIGEWNYYEPEMATLEAHLFIPSDLNFITALKGPAGDDRIVATTAGLMQTLSWINDHSWKADFDEVMRWSERGPPSDKANTLYAEEGPSGVFRLLSWAKKKRGKDKAELEAAAQFAFALYNRALVFSIENNVPILTDE